MKIESPNYVLSRDDPYKLLFEPLKVLGAVILGLVMPESSPFLGLQGVQYEAGWRSPMIHLFSHLFP
ncbi:MAG: hypothetical protein OEY83_03720 [Candidatus Bathyarchaeota archaeon]|nr:hypothetical protein [Candidatus Bathyarchaeota archaeon]